VKRADRADLIETTRAGGTQPTDRAPLYPEGWFDEPLPVSRGGTDDPSNLVPACKPCNVRKSNQSPDGWPLLIEPVS
jgi:5-methylcytosine-specific restriction endonuclease McrA